MIQEDFDLEWEERNFKNTTVGQHMFCGSLAGLFEHILALPMENIKVFSILRWDQ